MSNLLFDSCLLTNDDGPSTLLRVTVETVRPLVRDLVVVVPRQDQMAVSSAITLGKPIGVSFERSIGAWLGFQEQVPENVR
jgi:broad specificity polyphosphatase/5'/3'-nucleotidase SurE